MNSRDKKWSRFPAANVYWRSIPKTAKVKFDTGLYVVTHNGRRAVAYWHGMEALEAQKALDARSKKARK